jgi:outer membrane immunogenic protein
MKRLTLALAFAGAVLLPVAGVHADETYLGADFSLADLSTGAGDANPLALGVRFGRNFNANFGIEGRAGIGLTDDDVGGADVKLKHYAGLFAKGTVPFNDLFSGYAVIGYSTAKRGVEALGSTDDNGVSFGIGGQYHIGAMSSVHVEYLRIVEDVNAFQLGMTFNFGD